MVDFQNWNAHSVYFLDPAGNVLEYIARHDLKNPDNAPFGWSDILYVSEIALVVDDVAAMAETLKGTAAVSQYKNGDAESRSMLELRRSPHRTARPLRLPVPLQPK